MPVLFAVISLLFSGSVAFAQAHPCDSTPVSVSSVLVGEAFTVGACHDGMDTSTPPRPITVTEYRVYRNGVRLTGIPLSIGPTLNAAGRRYVSITTTEKVPGTVTFAIAAASSAGEGARGVPLSLLISAPPPVPGATTGQRVVSP